MPNPINYKEVSEDQKKELFDSVKEMDWTIEKYQRVLEIIQKYIPDIGIGKDGFKPI